MNDQRSLTAQLRDVLRYCNAEGMYDAADFIERHLREPKPRCATCGHITDRTYVCRCECHPVPRWLSEWDNHHDAVYDRWPPAPPEVTAKNCSTYAVAHDWSHLSSGHGVHQYECKRCGELLDMDDTGALL